MRMINIRWSREEKSFPYRVGGGDVWSAIYSDVWVWMDKTQFEKNFGGLFFIMERFNFIMRETIGDRAPGIEFRDHDGNLEDCWEGAHFSVDLLDARALDGF